MFSYNTGMEYVEAVPVSGTKGLSHTIANTAVVDNGDGTVKMTLSAAHGLLAGSVVLIEGTTHYDGLRKIEAIPSTTTINIKASYKAEVPAGTETVKVAIVPGRPFKLLGIRAHLADGGSTEENLTLTLDSHRGAAWDVALKAQAMGDLTDLNWVFPETENMPFHKDDIIRLDWDNTDGATFGIELLYKPLL